MRLNVERALADYNNALAGKDVANSSVTSASANVAVSEASIAEAKVVMDMAATDLARYEKLLEQDAVTRQVCFRWALPTSSVSLMSVMGAPMRTPRWVFSARWVRIKF